MSVSDTIMIDADNCYLFPRQGDEHLNKIVFCYLPHVDSKRLNIYV
jgi:hypothetical protein